MEAGECALIYRVAPRLLKVRGKRAEKAQQILDWMDRRHVSIDQIFSPGGKIYYPQATTSGDKNDRIFIPDGVSKGDLEGGEISRPEKSREVGIMVSACLSSIGGGVATRPHIVPTSQRVSDKYYCGHMLDAGLVPQMRDLASEHLPAGKGGGPQHFPQEDGASSHTARGARAFLAKMKVSVLGGDAGRGHLWPSNSPGLSPNDSFLRNSGTQSRRGAWEFPGRPVAS